MRICLEFKDDKASPGILHCEGKVEFEVTMKDALEMVDKLRESNIPEVLAKMLDGIKPAKVD